MILQGLPTVVRLYLGSLELRASDFQELFKDNALASLELLDVSGNVLKGASLKTIVGALSSSLTLSTFVAQFCGLEAKSVALLEPLFGTPPLTHLDVGYNKVGCCVCG